MGMTPKENFVAYFKGEDIERYPNSMTDVNFVMFPTGIDERSPKNQTGKDWYGCDWIYDPVNDACVVDTNKPYLLDDISEWRDKIVFPDLDKIDFEACAASDGVADFDPDKLTYLMLQEGPFERLHSLMPFEEALLSMMEEPEEVEELFDRIMEVKLKAIQAMIDYWHVEALNFHDDWGSQLNMFFSPEIWRELIKPQIKKAVDLCHENGVFFEMHTCGKVEKVIPELADIGVDSAQIMSINDIPALKEKTQGKLNYCVTVDYQTLAAEDARGILTEEMVRSRLDEEIKRYAPGGHYYPNFMPERAWYFPIEVDEIGRHTPVNA